MDVKDLKGDIVIPWMKNKRVVNGMTHFLGKKFLPFIIIIRGSPIVNMTTPFGVYA